MSETNYTYHHESFNLSETGNYTLVLQASGAGFTYVITDDNQLLAVAANLPLEELLNPRETAEELLSEYKSVVAAIDSNTFTLIPAELYDEAQVAYLARFLDVADDESVLAEQLDADNYIIYKVKTEVLEAVQKFNPQRIVYGGSEWINSISATQPGDNSIYLNITGSILQVLNFKNGKIAFYNTFDCQTTDDLVYFVGLALNAMQKQQQEVSIKINGSDADIQSRLSAYFPSVESYELSTVELPEELKSNSTINLSALLLCASSVAN